jgi:hypothetical protein
VKLSLDSIFNVDRRIVFIVVFVTLLVPLLVPFPMRCPATRDVMDIYTLIDDAAVQKKPVFLSFEFDPTGAAEQEPMARAVVRHIFSRGGKAVVMCKSGGQQGEALHLQILEECAQEYGASYGEDYCYLPYKPGSTNIVINLGQSLHSAWPKDYRNNNLSDLPITRNIARLADFDYTMIICSSLTTVIDWLTYGQAPYNLKMGFGVLGNVTPDCSNYVNSRQIQGLLGGLIGAAQYEQLLVDDGTGLFRRFSPADLVDSKMPDFCAALVAPNRSPVAQFIWDALSPAERQTVKSTAQHHHNELSLETKQTISKALNAAIMRDDIISEQDLKDLKIDGASTTLLERKEIASRSAQVRRRLFVESQFPDGLAKAQAAGQAMRWMTPQSIAHVVLIVAILFGNVCYLWDRARRKKPAQV